MKNSKEEIKNLNNRIKETKVKLKVLQKDTSSLCEEVERTKKITRTFTGN